MEVAISSPSDAIRLFNLTILSSPFLLNKFFREFGIDFGWYVVP